MLAGLVIDEFGTNVRICGRCCYFYSFDHGYGWKCRDAIIDCFFVRGLSLGHIDLNTFFKHFLKETGIGLSLGIVVGIVSGIVASVWQGIPLLGVAVGDLSGCFCNDLSCRPWF